MTSPRSNLIRLLALSAIALTLLSALVAVGVRADGGSRAAGSNTAPPHAAHGAAAAPTPTPPTWTAPQIAKVASTPQLPIGTPIRFTLTVKSASPNQAIWHDVTVTDPVDPAFHILAVTVPVGVSYTITGNVIVITKPVLGPVESFVAHIDCLLVGPAQPGDVLLNQSRLQYNDSEGVPQQRIDAEPVEITVVPTRIYLPVIQRMWAPTLAAPTLSPIDNPGNDNDYDVTWSAVAGAESYLLEEALKDDFANATTVYFGPNTSYAARSRQPTRYHYRVKAYTVSRQSAWSNAVETDVLWELEPNDNGLTEANGPLLSDLTYYGLFPRQAQSQDYFYFDLPAAHSVEIRLTNIAAGNDFDVVLRTDTLAAIAESRNPGSEDEYLVVGGLAAARYKIQVYHYSGPGNATQAYHLRLDYQ